MLVKAESLQIKRKERDVFLFLYLTNGFTPPRSKLNAQRNHKFTALKYTKIPLKSSGITVPHCDLNGQARSYDVTLRL